MRGAPWIAVVEALMVKKLLESPAFHRAIGKAHKSVHRLRHGTPPEEMGGTNIDNPNARGFLGHFLDEIKGQAGGVAKTREGGQVVAKREAGPGSASSAERPSPAQSRFRAQEQRRDAPEHTRRS